MSDEVMADGGPDSIAKAIAALTAVARNTPIIGQATSSEHSEMVDFAEVACRVITSVAANVGGIETLLSGRPGSWEADHIRQIIQSTAGEEDTALLRYRTAPVLLTLDVEDTFDDFGLGDLYAEATETLERREIEAEAALFDAVATAEEKRRLEQIRAQSTGRLFIETDPDKQAREVALVREAQDITDAIIQCAKDSGEPLAAALDLAADELKTLERLWELDQVKYADAYRETIQRVLSERGATVAVELLTDAADLSWVADAAEWDALTEELHQIAREKTPLPMNGQAPDWTDGKPADALRRSGLSFIARME